MNLKNIKDKVDILKVYKKLMNSETEINLKNAGLKVYVECFYPEHGDEDNGCVLERSKGGYYCLECRRAGDVVDMIKVICGVNEEDAMNWICQNYNLKTPDW